MKYRIDTHILENEHWWGGVVDDAWQMPLSARSEYRLDLTKNMTYNQGASLFLSDKGRYIRCEKGFVISFSHGEIAAEAEEEIVLYEKGGTLRGAYLHASAAYFPPDGKYPDETMFRVPQYCTWIELLNEQTEENILSYAESILEGGMPAGEIIIDGGWQTDYGDWTFHPAKFRDPKGMIEKLHAMGFKVIMWIVPYISPDSKNFLALEKAGGMIRRPDGEVYLLKWWEGWSASLDFTNPSDVEWFYRQTDRLMKEYGVDGFKQDGGDARFLLGDYRCKDGDANRQSEMYALSALRFPFNELRACFNCGGRGIAQRITDRHHSWDVVEGVGSLVPNSCLQGLLGYPFVCPDMAGGGLSGDFFGKKPEDFDTELFIRSAQASSMMPMMQLSYSFWRKFDKNTADICIRYTLWHAKLHGYMMECVKNAAATGEPIVRNMSYAFNCYPECKDQFALGEKYLVAPVIVKGARSRVVKFPEGRWKRLSDGKIFTGGEREVDAALDELPAFEKLL
ncbi:MAG: glycoside hydrolase [Bacillota bacterium]|nr:MAG: glycoside hydrolase [Bacillota bacterium]